MHSIFNDVLLDEESPMRSMKIEGESILYRSDTDLDEYIIDCGKSLSAVDTTNNKAKQAILMLDFEHLNVKNCPNYDLAEYIEFHVESYIIRAHSIYDRTLIFVNKLLGLGISNDSIGHQSIVTNDNVIKVGLNDKLKSLKRTFNQFHQIRNSIIHHDRYKDKDFELVATVHKTEFLLKQIGKESITPQNTINIITENYVETKKFELEKNLEKIELKLMELYDLAVIVYHKRKNLLR